MLAYKTLHKGQHLKLVNICIHLAWSETSGAPPITLEMIPSFMSFFKPIFRFDGFIRMCKAICILFGL